MKRVPLMFRALALVAAAGCADNSALEGAECPTCKPPTDLPLPPTTGGNSNGTNGGGYKIGDSVDVDGDGTVDGIVVDDNGDGVADGVDTNSDGKSDRPLPAGAPGVPDGGTKFPMPVADEPCGMNVDFKGGTVAPKLGTIQAPPGAGSDPAAAGMYKTAEIAVKVPIKATMLSAAGYDIAVEDGELTGTFYVPSMDGTTIATDAKFPLLVGGAGFQAAYADYKGYWTQFASHGIAVLGITTRGSNTEALHDKEALETSLAITWALTESDLNAQLDPDKVATTGHSKGGKVAFFAAAIDPRIDIVFGWDPSNAGGPPCFINGDVCHNLPVAPNCGSVEKGVEQPEGILQYMQAESFVFGVPPDGAINPEADHNAINFYRGAPSPADLVYFNGGHAGWLESGGAALLLGDADIVRITKMVQTAKLLKFFFGVKGMDDYLPPSGAKLMAESKVSMLKSK